MLGLASLKEKPTRRKQKNRLFRVFVQPVAFEDFQVSTKAYGTIVSKDVISISPLVSGRVVWVNPKSEAGTFIAEGEILFKIDPKDYELKVELIQAEEKELVEDIELLISQFRFERECLPNCRRNKELAMKEYNRLKKLYKNGQLVSKTTLDEAEIKFNTAVDSLKRGLFY